MYIYSLQRMTIKTYVNTYELGYKQCLENHNNPSLKNKSSIDQYTFKVQE